MNILPNPARMRTGLLIFALVAATYAIGGEVAVTGVKATDTAPGIYRFDVTLLHADEGWDHYADAWEVLDPDGNVIATRVLTHPHVNEQPFTRSLLGVAIHNSTGVVQIRPHDSLHGFGPVVIVKLSNL